MLSASLRFCDTEPQHLCNCAGVGTQGAGARASSASTPGTAGELVRLLASVRWATELFVFLLLLQVSAPKRASAAMQPLPAGTQQQQQQQQQPPPPPTRGAAKPP